MTTSPARGNAGKPAPVLPRLITILGSQMGAALWALLLVVFLPAVALLAILFGITVAFGDTSVASREQYLLLGARSLGFLVLWLLTVLGVSRFWVTLDSKRATHLDDPEPDELSLATPVNSHWLEAGPSRVLNTFLSAFENSLSSLRDTLALRLGPELEQALPLHQQIGFAQELHIWSEEDIAKWRTCLRLRQELLADGATPSRATLIERAVWLNALSRRTSECAIQPHG